VKTKYYSEVHILGTSSFTYQLVEKTITLYKLYR